MRARVRVPAVAALAALFLPAPAAPWTAPAGGPGPDVGAVYPVHHRGRRERKRARQRARRAGLR